MQPQNLCHVLQEVILFSNFNCFFKFWFFDPTSSIFDYEIKSFTGWPLGYRASLAEEQAQHTPRSFKRLHQNDGAAKPGYLDPMNINFDNMKV